MAGEFVGFVTLDGTLIGPLITTENGALKDAASLPTYRIYGPNGIMTNGTGTCAYLQSGVITGATNASPIVITSDNHGLQAGQRVTIENVGGNTAANGTHTVANPALNTFELSGTTGNGAYTSGGTWHLTGQYKYTHVAAAANGFEVNEHYSVRLTATIGSIVAGTVDTFAVV